MTAKFKLSPKLFLAVAVLGAIAWPYLTSVKISHSDDGKLGKPVPGLTIEQRRKFDLTETAFRKEFTPEEGLGPLFNGRSCFECHGQPGAIGGEGRDVASTGVVRIGSLNPTSHLFGKPPKEVAHLTEDPDVQTFLLKGGPALERKSITSEFPNKYPEDCQVEIGTIPTGTQFISMRHAGPLFGFGLIEAIADEDITSNIFKELDQNPKMAGRSVAQDDPLTKSLHIGRFGWKCQRANLMLFSAEALDVEMGITTPVLLHPKSAEGISKFPHKLIPMLPHEPNDNGKLMTQMAYFQALLASPPRGPITDEVKRGEQVFNKLQCSVCHIPEMHTRAQVFLADPESPFPRLKYIEVEALENKPVRAYSDFLIHNMGPGLADGLPQNGAGGGEWRTTPLWGLRNKKFLLHDGRTNDLNQVIALHGGQAEEASKAYALLDERDKADLIAFLKSL